MRSLDTFWPFWSTPRSAPQPLNSKLPTNIATAANRLAICASFLDFLYKRFTDMRPIMSTNAITQVEYAPL
ncbi:hypothetical protein PSCICL_34720 [Pseudomonas cichorii]|nr:hypothetical protein PSCICL_34720 [Pseudomonas cichorii]